MGCLYSRVICRSVLLLLLRESQSALLVFSLDPSVLSRSSSVLPWGYTIAWENSGSLVDGAGVDEGNAGFPAIPSFSARDARYTQCPWLLNFECRVLLLVGIPFLSVFAVHFLCLSWTFIPLNSAFQLPVPWFRLKYVYFLSMMEDGGCVSVCIVVLQIISKMKGTEKSSPS